MDQGRGVTNAVSGKGIEKSVGGGNKWGKIIFYLVDDGKIFWGHFWGHS